LNIRIRRINTKWHTAMAAEEASEEETSAQEKCTKLLALNAERNAKFHSSQQKASQFTAENVTLREHLEDSSISV
jgi:ABC-type transport system involved in cytochrome bd biosynthesis fused ATPase/permease subunit